MAMNRTNCLSNRAPAYGKGSAKPVRTGQVEVVNAR